MQREELQALFGCHHPIIGMVHLLPLPGSPRSGGKMRVIIERALADAAMLESNGVAGLMVENFGDVPFYPDRVPPETVAAMAAVVCEIRRQSQLPLGVNVLRNDGYAAMAIAAGCGGQFIRVNVLAGAAVTDQGLLNSKAHQIVRLRQRLGVDVKIFADVMVKHATSLSTVSLEQAAHELIERALADAVICTGAKTGSEIELQDLECLRQAMPSQALIAGSGVTPQNAGRIFQHADAAIVGTYFKEEGRVDRPVVAARVKELVERTREG